MALPTMTDDTAAIQRYVGRSGAAARHRRLGRGCKQVLSLEPWAAYHLWSYQVAGTQSAKRGQKREPQQTTRVAG
jgi:hypothetical protein